MLEPTGHTTPIEELPLKYGCNPDQRPASVSAPGGLPFRVRNGRPGYINLLDALHAWVNVTPNTSRRSREGGA